MQLLFADKCSLGNICELGECCLEIGIPLGLDKSLARPHSRWSTLSIARIETIDNVHAFNHFSKGTETLLIKKSVSLFPCVDKNLRSSSIWTGGRKDNCSSRVTYFDGIIWNAGGSPFGLNRGITVDSKLRDKAGKNSKETTTIPKRFLC